MPTVTMRPDEALLYIARQAEEATQKAAAIRDPQARRIAELEATVIGFKNVVDVLEQVLAHMLTPTSIKSVVRDERGDIKEIVEWR